MVINERIVWAGLPRIDINTQTNATAGFAAFSPAAIDKDLKRNCSATFSDGYGSSFFPSPFTTNITIKGRGNYTWTRPKKPYNIVICGTNDFTKRNVRLFNMSTDSDWTLLADYDDFTHARDLVSSAVGFAFGQWAARCIKVEVFWNGVYGGLYTFCERVSRTTERINITKLGTGDNAAPAVTGGYVIEGKTADQIASGEKQFSPPNSGEPYSYKIPDAADVTDAQNAYVETYVNDFLTKLYNVPFSDTVNGYRSVSDPVSFAVYYLIQDVIGNADRNSFYMTKDRGGVLKGGPFWDAGIAFGIRGEPAAATGYWQTRSFLGKLISDPYFQQLLRTQLLPVLPKLHQIAADLRDFGARLRSATTQDGTGKDAIDREALQWQDANQDWPGDYDLNFPALVKFFLDRLYWQNRRYYFPLTPAHATVNA